MTNFKQKYIELSKKVLQDNDRGTYTVPTKGLYPFQWNWDSCLTALGQMHVDEARAWQEIETLFEHQWEDGMVPHIIFHELDEGYFPGPDVWHTNRPTPTTGISQPAVAGFAIKKMFDRCKNRELAEVKAKLLLPKVMRWHQWFYANRDPERTGLVAIIHPWESGRDNSIDWDDAFERVPTEGVEPFTRRDTSHANPAHRPTQAQYERYIWLVQHFRSLKWDNTKLHDASPFQVVDPGFNGILIRSCADLAELANQLGEKELSVQSATMAEKGRNAIETLWSEELSQYICYDRKIKKLIKSPSIGGLLAAFGVTDKEKLTKIATRIQKLSTRAKYMIPSHDPDTEGFDGDRYWRGPAWLIVNYMIADGLKLGGQTETADEIVRSSLKLIEVGGMAEYYNPHTGEGCGGAHFTWTAAMVLEFLINS